MFFLMRQSFFRRKNCWIIFFADPAVFSLPEGLLIFHFCDPGSLFQPGRTAGISFLQKRQSFLSRKDCWNFISANAAVLSPPKGLLIFHFCKRGSLFQPGRTAGISFLQTRQSYLSRNDCWNFIFAIPAVFFNSEGLLEFHFCKSGSLFQPKRIAGISFLRKRQSFFPRKDC